jgi:putative membrane protein
MKRIIKIPRIVKPFEHKEKLILRDYLAMQRTTLANERTLFSYIRTSLYLVIGGIGLLKLEDFESLAWLGYVSLAISALMIFYGVVRYIVLKRKLSKFYKDIGVPEDM